MPGMGGAGGDFGGIDFSKLGGGAGMPDMSGMGMGMGEEGEEEEDSGDEEDEDEDEMPALEGDKPKA
jgi:hypothetical protein